MVLALISRLWLPLTIFVWLAITLLSLTPLPELPLIPGSDKAHHLIAYGLLAFPVALRQPRYWLYISLSFIIWSGAIELIQPYVNRYGEWLDLVANSLGVLLGLSLATLARHYMNRPISASS